MDRLWLWWRGLGSEVALPPGCRTARTIHVFLLGDRGYRLDWRRCAWFTGHGAFRRLSTLSPSRPIRSSGSGTSGAGALCAGGHRALSAHGTFRERLGETEAHLGRIFEDAPVGILILDGGTRIRKVNPAFRQFLGTLPTADNEIADVVHADSQPQVRAFLDRLTHERPIANVAEIGFLNG